MDAVTGLLSKHTKLCGGGMRTASHDRNRMKDARDAVAKANRDEADRAALRSQRRSRVWEDE